MSQVKDVQLLRPLFEFSGACSGCGETPYVKLMTQLFGDRMLIGNATGCSSIYGGNLPTTPYCHNDEGRGPTWSNSLFEDNAEFGLGMRLAVDKQNEYARELVARLSGAHRRRTWSQAILNADQKHRAGHLRAARAGEGARARSWPASDTAKRATCCSRGRRAGQEERLDPGRRWLGLRYRLRRAGPRARHRPQRQRAGARYRSLLQHRRPGVQIHAARRGGQVRRRRQAGGQEGPGHDGGELRQRLRGARGHGRRATCTPSRRSSKPKPTTGRRSSSPTAIASPTATTWPTAWSSRRLAVNSGYWPLFRYNPDLVAQGKNPVPARFARAHHPAQGLHLQRDPLHHAGQEQSRSSQEAAGRWRRRTSTSHWKLYDYMAHEPATARR